MKYIFLVPDGAADHPIEALSGRTPLEAAEIPFMRALARKGVVGRVRTVESGFHPSSDVANLSLLGYQPAKYYKGRGPLEAANLGVKLDHSDIAFRCNLITEAEGKVRDYSAGHISDREAKILIEALNKELADDSIRFYHGTSYRNLMVYRDCAKLGLDKLTYWPPHDILGREALRHFPRGKNSALIARLMEHSRQILAEHEVNKVRLDLGENPANMIWLWGCGTNPSMPLFSDKFGLSGGVISAVDLIKGIGRLIGLKVPDVSGATGYYDTNYLGKAHAALDILKNDDFVFIHVEATDEAGHNGDLRAKLACLERIDKMIVGTLMQELTGDYRILIAPDHPTPVAKRTHTAEPVPFLISGTGIGAGGFLGFSEQDAAASEVYFERGWELIEYLFKGSR